MDIKHIKSEWQSQNPGNNLVIKLFRESKLTQIDNTRKKLIIYSLLFMFFNLLCNIYTWLVLIANFSSLSICISGLVTLLLTYIVFYKNVQQLSLLAKIDPSKPVIEMQKAIEKLKISRIHHNRFIFIFSNLFFWMMLSIWFQWDFIELIPFIWQKAAVVPAVHIGFAIIWLPLSLWLLKKYDTKASSSGFWNRMSKNSQLTDFSINNTLNQIVKDLREIEKFEKENTSA